MNWKSLVIATALGLAVIGCGDSAPTATPTTKTTSAPSVDTLKKNADRFLADITADIKDGKWDLADKAFAKLEETRSKLPAEYGVKIDAIKQALAAGKAATKAAGTAPAKAAGTAPVKAPATAPATAPTTAAKG
jgi:hypothetical protein